MDLAVPTDSGAAGRHGRLRRRAQRFLAALATIALVLGMVPGAAAAGRDGDASKLEPALLSAISARPGDSFGVIVQRAAAWGAAERRARRDEVENELRAQGGQKSGRLDLVDGHVVTLAASAITKLSRDPRIKSISLNHRVELAQLTTQPLPL